MGVWFCAPSGAPESALNWENVVQSAPTQVAQLGSAPALGAGGRRFKSCLPDQYKPLEIAVSGFGTAGASADGKRQRRSKSGFVSQDEAQKYIDEQLGPSDKRSWRGVGYVEKRPSRTSGDYVVRIYVGEAANGRKRTKIFGRWDNRKAAEDALVAYIEEQGL